MNNSDECQPCRDASAEIARREGVDPETAYKILHHILHRQSRSRLRKISVTAEGAEIEVRDGHPG